jgi:CBS domain containing-hemolysin-like protein
VLYGPLRVLGALTVPLVRPWDLLITKALRRLTGAPGDERVATSEEDLRLLVDVVEETEALEDEEREMITSIFELSDRDVREIMIPRVDLVAIESSTSVSDAVRIVISSGHSRVPVYEEDLDHIVGIVHLRDLAAKLESGRKGEPVAELVRPAHIVPETKKIDELLREFQVQRIQMAVVADEYGGTAGLVTIEDLLEEIVGEIHDEYDVLEQPITRTGERELVVNASVSIHDVNEELGLELDDDDYGTLGGLVVARLGKLPVVGDSVLLEQCSIRVLSVTGHRVDRVQVTLEEPA